MISANDTPDFNQNRDCAKHSQGAHFHGHHHHRHDAGAGRRRLTLVLALTATYMVAEVFGGLYTGSLALLADAGHMLTDVAALALALFAMWFGGRPATSRKTFGYYRLEILAALVNGVTLVIVSLFIFREAYGRWLAPPEVNSTVMMGVAAGGLIINLIGAWLLHGDHKENLNMRGAWLHIIGDALGSVGAIIAGLLMTLYGWYVADPAFSVVIGALIIWSSWQIIREATNVLLEGTPAHINLAAVENTFRETEGVADVHDLHVWTITSGREALSAHVVHTERAAPPELLRRLRTKLRERFGVDHLTIQMETVEFASDAAHPCHTVTDCFGGQKTVSGKR